MWLRDYPSGISLRCVRRSDVPAGAWSWVFVRQLRRPLGQEVSTARALSAAELSAGRSIAYLSYAGIMFAMRVAGVADIQLSLSRNLLNTRGMRCFFTS